MTIKRSFIRPETVPMWAEITDPKSGIYVDPSEDVLLTLRDPDGEIVVDMEDVVMTKYDTGIYVYYWTSTPDVEGEGEEAVSTPQKTGYYKYRVTSQDGIEANLKTSVEAETFELR